MRATRERCRERAREVNGDPGERCLVDNLRDKRDRALKKKCAYRDITCAILLFLRNVASTMTAARVESVQMTMGKDQLIVDVNAARAAEITSATNRTGGVSLDADLDDPRFRIRPYQQIIASCTGAFITSIFGEFVLPLLPIHIYGIILLFIL